MFQNDLLHDKRILVTGGGSGLGAAMARRFAELGASPVLCGRRSEPLEQTAETIRAECNCPVQIFPCDIRNPQAVESMFDAIFTDGPLDGLVNNAAATFIAQTERLSPNAFDAVLSTTLHGAVYCTLAAGRRWIELGRRGVILSMLSTSVRTGRAFTVPSAVAKSGLQAMTQSLAVEWGSRGIRLVAIAPGPFPTDATRAQLLGDQRAAAAPATTRNPMGRVGRPGELADLASYLISDAASFINGETVAIDGGAHLRTSGAEDLLGWSPEQWETQRARRSSAKR